MKELTANEMEYISGAGIIDLPCALVDFTIQSALGLVAAGINAGMILASSALETTIDRFPIFLVVRHPAGKHSNRPYQLSAVCRIWGLV